MSLMQPDRLKSQLLTSGLQQKDPVLYQIINSLIDIIRGSNIELAEVSATVSGGTGITELTGDVVAGPGSGSQVATIQPDAVTTPKILNAAVTTAKIADNNVTYGKIQQVSAVKKLLGNDEVGAPANVKEIGLGSNLDIQSGNLVITPSGGGGTGLGHEVLSATHTDSNPADAVLGDIIVAQDGGQAPATYAHFMLNSPIKENFTGIRFGYVCGFNGQELGNGNVMWGAPPVLSYVTNNLENTWETWNLLDFFMQTSIVEDFTGYRYGMIGGTPGGFAYINGNNMGYAASMLAMINAPDFANPTLGVLWARLGVGTSSQVLQPVNGVPAWKNDLSLAGNANIGGSVVITGDLDAVNASLSVTSVVALASISSPIINGKALGTWVNVAFNAGNFTANGGTTPTWTLTSPDQVTFQYMYISENTMVVQVYLATTTVASVAGAVTELRIKIPDSRTAVGQSAQLAGAQENGVAVFDIYVGVDSTVDGTQIFLRTFPIGAGRGFDQTANASYFGFTLPIRLNA